jgi:hypothetical protein
MTENRVVAVRQKGAIDDPLTEILRTGARRLIAQAVEAEFETFLASTAELVLPDGRRRVVRHGHDPVRAIQTGIGRLPGKQRPPAFNQQNQANFLASQKQEAAFAKQIDQLADNVRQISKAIGDQINDLKKTNDDKFGDLKDRIVAMEGRSSVSDPNTAAALRDTASAISTLKQSRDEGFRWRQQKADSTAWIFSAIAVAIAIAVMAIDFIRTAH